MHDLPTQPVDIYHPPTQPVDFYFPPTHLMELPVYGSWSNRDNEAKAPTTSTNLNTNTRQPNPRQPNPRQSNPRQPNPRQPNPSKKIPWYNPRRWHNPCIRRLCPIILLPILVLVLIIVLVVIPVIEKNTDRYPSYKPLNYFLVDDYSGPTFFEKFNYFTEEDPTKGFVVYVNKETATNLNLTYATNTSAILRVDAKTPNAKHGRNSVRIESKHTYNDGLFIFDIIHTPFGCATWPALWLTDGYNWPSNGEIDILETTNEGSHGNEITLHTTKGCSMNVRRKQTGQQLSKKCDDTNDGNAGCGVLGEDFTYGEAMNNIGGGVYALELRKEGIRTWFFPRESIPNDILRGFDLDPYKWGTALADFPNTKCDIGRHFRNQSIIVNIDLCGELAAQPQYYDTMYHCPGTCTDLVARFPGSFVDAYWEFKSFRVYRSNQPKEQNHQYYSSRS